jgi:hypothetical protein
MSQINQELNTITEMAVVCPICLENISGSKNMVITECGHSFHCNCLMTNVSHNGFKCPYCRTKMCENDDSEEEDSESTETDSVYTEIYEDDMLRGLRLFNNIINGEEHTEEDISEERFYAAYLEMVEQNNNGDGDESTVLEDINDDDSTVWEDTDDEGYNDNTNFVNRYQEQCYNGSRFYNPEYLAEEEKEEEEIKESNMLRGYRLFYNLINDDENDKDDINLETYYYASV